MIGRDAKKPQHGGGLGRSARSSVVVMGCTFLSRLLGFARIAVITGVFGAGTKADIINLTFSIPNNLRKLLAEGALSSAFVPELSRTLVEERSGSRARALVGKLMSFQLLLVVPLSALSMAAARPLIARVLSEFRNPDDVARAIGLFRYFINYLPLIGISAVLMGVLNAHHRFVVPAVTPILFSIAVIVSIVTLSGAFDIYAVAVGVLSGGLLQILFQLPFFGRLGYRVRLDFGFSDPTFRRVLAVWLPVLATSSVFTVTYQVAIRFASGIGPGSVTSLAIAITFFQLPFGIFSSSVTTVLFPRMSRQAALDDRDGLRESLEYGLRFLGVLLVPSAIFLFIAGRGLVSVAFQRGDFDYATTVRTAAVLTAYALGLFSVGAFAFMQRLFYATGSHRIPFRAAVVVAVVDIGLSLWLKETPLRTAGIALANTVSFSVGFVMLLFQAQRTIGRIEGGPIARTAVRTCVSLVPAVAAVYASRLLTGSWWIAGSTPKNLLLLLIEVVVFCAVVLIGYRLTRVEMMSMLLMRRSIDE